MPSKNKIVETARYLTKSIEGDNFVNRCYLFKKTSARENNLCSQKNTKIFKIIKRRGRDTGYGIRDTGYGIWDMGYGMGKL